VRRSRVGACASAPRVAGLVSRPGRRNGTDEMSTVEVYAEVHVWFSFFSLYMCKVMRRDKRLKFFHMVRKKNNHVEVYVEYIGSQSVRTPALMKCQNNRSVYCFDVWNC